MPPSPSTPATSSAAPSPSGPAPGPKAHLPPKITGSYAEIDRLAGEKLALAQRIVDLLTRTRARLDADLTKVGVLQGDVPEPPRPSFAPLPLSPDPYVVHGRNPVQQISDSLRTALAGPAAAASAEIALPAAAASPGPSAPKSECAFFLVGGVPRR